jgi:formyltetrahydrofolate-dependent phosphoribosylglycinamide formyltransferase
MLNKLASKWKLNGGQLFLVLTTFALGGSLCGYVSRQLLSQLSLKPGILWVIIYIVLVTITWPFCVLLISLLTGQFRFFKNYIFRLSRKFMKPKKTKVAIFASGAGSNAARIISEFAKETISVALIVTNKKEAGVVQIAKDNNIEVLFLEKKRFEETGYCEELKQHNIEWIVLAGFLWKVPPVLIESFRNRIINIHPALLPAYGGKGMYGAHVHNAVIGNREKYSGITIHMVDEVYDHGKIIFQARCDISENDTTESLAARIHELEHRYYPDIIRSLVKGKSINNIYKPPLNQDAE